MKSQRKEFVEKDNYEAFHCPINICWYYSQDMDIFIARENSDAFSVSSEST